MIDALKKYRSKEQKTSLDRAVQCLEILFLVVSGFFLLTRALSTTTFYIPMDGLDAWLPKVMLGSALVHLVLVGMRRWTAWLSLIMAAVCYFVFRQTGYIDMVYLAAMTIGFAGVDYRKILKALLFSVGTCFLVAVFAALSGAITNFVYPSVGHGIRSSWGICYPTDLASTALYLLLALWVVWHKLPDWAAMPLCALLNWIRYSVCAG